MTGDVEELAMELRLGADSVRENDNTALANSNDDFGLLESKLHFLRKELQQYISEAHLMAYTDSLTGLGNRNAYTEVIKRMDAKIAEGTADFSVAVFDINGLK